MVLWAVPLSVALVTFLIVFLVARTPRSSLGTALVLGGLPLSFLGLWMTLHRGLGSTRSHNYRHDLRKLRGKEPAEETDRARLCEMADRMGRQSVGSMVTLAGATSSLLGATARSPVWWSVGFAAVVMVVLALAVIFLRRDLKRLDTFVRDDPATELRPTLPG